MKKSIVTLVLIFVCLLATPLVAGPIFEFIGLADIYISEACAQKMKGEDFITGNKITGKIRGSEAGFVMIAVTSADPSKKEYKVVVIPLAEIIYIKGKEKLVNF